MLHYKTEPDAKEQLDKILHPLVKQWFYTRYKEFSLPQKLGVMEIHGRKNCLISAPTGATKTLTAFLSILNELVDTADKNLLRKRVYAVYISPLKALNNDIQKNLMEPLAEIEALAGRSLGIQVMVRTGDTTAYEKSKMLENPPHILVTTPESLAVMLTSAKFKYHLHDAQWVVIDEIHALAENKRGVHLSITLERLQRVSPSLCRIGLSATIAPIEEVAKFLVGFEKNEPRPCSIVDIRFLKKLDLKVLSPVPNIITASYEKIQNETYALLHQLIQEHKTTLIFTNTRSGTERVVHGLKLKYPQYYDDNNIATHHGSLSKELRLKTEEDLRAGKLRCVICSTSLELGIDIGFIDLVILLGSPKSVARAIQRCGRAGHKLHEVTKGRIIITERDDLVECAVLLKAAIEHIMDEIHIPRNSLDVLCQQIFGCVIEERITKADLYAMLQKSYCYHTLSFEDYISCLDFLEGKFASLEDRNIYARIWVDEQTQLIGKRGKLASSTYMTNIGTIPDESFITIKVGTQPIGKIDEGFLEKLQGGDIFVLGGNTYQFIHAKGMVAQVIPVAGRKPTVPRWNSEMLPLSFGLAMQINKFRRLVEEKLHLGKPKSAILDFIKEYVYVDENAANSIYEYLQQQYEYAMISHDQTLVVEHYDDGKRKHTVFHSLYGRRVNDVLSRAVAYVVSHTQMRDVDIGLNDNSFMLSSPKKINVARAMEALHAEDLKKLMVVAIDKTEVLKRRFRHCATRALMILRTYKGQRKNVGKQQVSSMILLSAVKRLSEQFCVLKEARREVLEDLMDIKNAMVVLSWIEEGKIKIREITTDIPSPFAFKIVGDGYSDIMKLEDKQEFLRRMHDYVATKIDLKRRGKDLITHSPVNIAEQFVYEKEWERQEQQKKEEIEDHELLLRTQLLQVSRRLNLDPRIVHDINKLIDGQKEGFHQDFVPWLTGLLEGVVPKQWPDNLVRFLQEKFPEIR